MKKIDIHMHTSLHPVHPVLNGTELSSVEELLPLIDRYNIEKSVLMSSGETGCLMDNEEVRQICGLYPDRFCYMAVFDFNHPVDLAGRIRRQLEAGAKGVGEFTANVSLDDEKVWNLLEILEDLGMPVLFHFTPQLGGYYGVYDEAGFPKLEKTLQRFPRLSVIAHSQPFWFEMEAWEKTPSPEARNGYPQGKIRREGRVQYLLRNYPNLWCDLSANSGGGAIMRDSEYGIRFLKEFQDRLLFGTDLYNCKQYFPLGDYLDQLAGGGQISETVWKKIVRDNAMELLHLT